MKAIFPKAVHPPKLVKSYGRVLGYIAAAMFVVMALVHMFRIDTLVPIIDKVMPRGLVTAGTFVVVIVLAEVFAIPFLLRLKLSPLAHLFSGFLTILAPLMWSLLTIWTYGLNLSTGQLGEFVSLPTTWWLITVNLVWLTFNFFVLWALGYNNLKIKDVLKLSTPKKQSKS